MELSSHKLKKLTYFRREFAKPENQKFLILFREKFSNINTKKKGS